jgi:hypothetical protein
VFFRSAVALIRRMLWLTTVLIQNVPSNHTGYLTAIHPAQRQLSEELAQHRDCLNMRI